MEEIRRRFFLSMRDKKFYKQFVSIFSDGVPLGEIELAKALSSMLTHSLIEMEKEGAEVYRSLDILYQMDILSRFIGGEIDEKAVRDGYKKRYGIYFRREWPEVIGESSKD